MSVLDNWQQWKHFLGDRLDQAEKAGMSEQVISDLAYQIGDYLANKVQPKNEQEKVLSDLWSVASEQEQHALANMMVRLVQNDQ
jgi:predicted metal-binding transcription factor (methanogenesis marker protein 9)